MQDQRSLLNRAVSRLMDLSVALFILIFLSWFLLIICILIRLETKGFPIFRQKRAGISGRPFNCYKFRTMFINTENVATHEVSVTQITRLGRFLRASKIDELPQAWNIIKNEMSLVGPRPCLITQDVIIAEREKRRILTIKPGITGWSQIHRIDMSDAVKLAESDAQYLAKKSLLLDVKILVFTILGKGIGDVVKS